MNLIDAIKSGRPWRPTNSVVWRDPIERSRGYNELRIELGELFLEYEIQEPTVTISRTQLGKAFKEAFLSRSNCGIGDFEDELARKLGLEADE